MKNNANGVASSAIEITAGKVMSCANRLWPNARTRAAADGVRARMSSANGMPNARNSGVIIKSTTVWAARIQKSVVS